MSLDPFVDRGSIVRTIWGDPDLVLLIFAGSAAEFALNRAGLVQTYGIVNSFNLQPLVHGLLIPPRYWSEVRRFDRRASLG